MIGAPVLNGTQLECEGEELRPDGSCAKCERINQRIQAAFALAKGDKSVSEAGAVAAARDLAEAGYFRFDIEHDDADYQQTVIKTAAAIISKHCSAPSTNLAAEAIETLREIRALVKSSRSWVLQDNAAEMILRLEELGLGTQEGRRGNTLWAMVMDAADEIARLRATTPAAPSARCYWCQHPDHGGGVCPVPYLARGKGGLVGNYPCGCTRSTVIDSVRCAPSAGPEEAK